jgi:O-antigen ligase
MAARRRKKRRAGAEALAAAPRAGEEHLALADRALDAVLALSVLIVPLAIHPGLFNTIIAKDMAFGAFVLLMGALLVVKVVAKQPVSWPRAHLNMAVWAMILAALVSAAFAQYRYAAAGALGGLLAGGMFYFVVIMRVKAQAQARMILAAAAVGAMVASAHGILQHFGVDPVMHLPKGERVMGPYGNATFFASYLVLLLPVMVNMCIFPPAERKRAAWRLLFAAAALLMAAALVFTGTAAALLGVAFAIGVNAIALAYGRYRGTGRAGRAVIIAAVCVVGLWAGAYALTPAAVRERVLSLRQPSDLSDVRRLMVWRGAARMFADRPLLGGGPGSFQIISRGRYVPYIVAGKKLEAAGAVHSHNAMLEALAETGVVGGVALIWLIAAYFAAAARVFKSKAEPFWKHLAAGLSAGVLAFVVQNIFAVTLFIASCQMLLWLALGLTVCALSSLRRDKVRTVMLRPLWLRAGLGGAYAAALVAICWWMGCVLVADRYLGDGFFLAQQRAFAEAALPLRKAVAVNPYAQRAWYQLAVAEVNLRNLASGLNDLERAAALSPDYMRTQLNLGGLYQFTGQWEKARRALERAASYEHSADTNISLARVYLALRKPGLAKARAREAERIDPYNAWNQRAIAQIMFKVGDLDAARLHVERAEELEPGSPDTAALRAVIQAAVSVRGH